LILSVDFRVHAPHQQDLWKYQPRPDAFLYGSAQNAICSFLAYVVDATSSVFSYNEFTLNNQTTRRTTPTTSAMWMIHSPPSRAKKKLASDQSLDIFSQIAELRLHLAVGITALPAAFFTLPFSSSMPSKHNTPFGVCASTHTPTDSE
jgi:hypothetical protein